MTKSQRHIHEPTGWLLKTNTDEEVLEGGCHLLQSSGGNVLARGCSSWPAPYVCEAEPGDQTKVKDCCGPERVTCHKQEIHTQCTVSLPALKGVYS